MHNKGGNQLCMLVVDRSASKEEALPPQRARELQIASSLPHGFSSHIHGLDLRRPPNAGGTGPSEQASAPRPRNPTDEQEILDLLDHQEERIGVRASQQPGGKASELD